MKWKKTTNQNWENAHINQGTSNNKHNLGSVLLKSVFFFLLRTQTPIQNFFFLVTTRKLKTETSGFFFSNFFFPEIRGLLIFFLFFSSSYFFLKVEVYRIYFSELWKFLQKYQLLFSGIFFSQKKLLGFFSLFSSANGPFLLFFRFRFF